MFSEENESTQQTGFFRQRLVSWPLALIGLSLLFTLLGACSGPSWGRHGAHDVEDIKSHADHFLDRALDRLDATDEQSTEIRAIVMSTIEEFHGSRDGFRSSHEDFKALLTADSIDRDAIEALRQSHLARADEMTRTLTTNLVDILEILTPEQRAEVEARFEKHHARHGRGHGRSEWH